ncbi:MAG: FAD-dependent oxidoreductase [Microcystis sp.]|jgi:thioredoxin reductase
MAHSTKGILDDSLFVRPADGEKLSFPILIVGGSAAAYSATLGALKAGTKVCLVQPQKVLGGQFTAEKEETMIMGYIGDKPVASLTSNLKEEQIKFAQRFSNA